MADPPVQERWPGANQNIFCLREVEPPDPEEELAEVERVGILCSNRKLANEWARNYFSAVWKRAAQPGQVIGDEPAYGAGAVRKRQ